MNEPEAKLSRGRQLIWDRVLAVAGREYAATVRTKAFVIALVMMPVLTLGALLVPLFAAQLTGDELRRVAVIDQTERTLPALRARLTLELADAATEEGLRALTSEPTPRLELVDAGHSADEATLLSLSERVARGELFAFVVIPVEVMPAGSDVSIRYVSNTPSSAGARRWLARSIEAEVHRARLGQLGVDVHAIERAQSAVRVQDEALRRRDGGAIAVGPEPNPLRDVALPLLAALLVFMSLMLGAAPLTQSTLEEKMQRIVEVVVSSVPPLTLMLGKLLGAALVSYTILSLYLLGGALVAAQLGMLDLLSLGDVLVILAFQAVAFAMYGSFFLAVGSACNDLKETQALMMPAVMLITLPLLLLQVVLDEPNGGASTGLSFFPFFTPPLMMLRHLVSPGAPAWQVAVGLVSSGVVAALCLWAASRIFRVGLLMQGGAPSYRQLYRWLRAG